jgi:hypothetical protein
MKAVLIDAKSRTVTDVDYSGDYKEIYKLIGCSCFTLVRNLPDGDEVFVDDEGLLKLTGDSPFFTIPWYPSPLAGSGLIVSAGREGETTDAKHDAEFYRRHVQFSGQRAVWLKEQLEPTGWPSLRVFAMDVPNHQKKED